MSRTEPADPVPASRCRALRALGRRVMARSQAARLDHFYALARPGNDVLDVGVTPELEPGGTDRTDHTDHTGRNAFLNSYRFAPETYTGLAVQDMTGMQDRYPGKSFVRYAGREFPFGGRSFDWVFSNAVIEHLGSFVDQVGFVREMVRVSRHGVFFTTPARTLAVEAHAGALLPNWLDHAFGRWCARHAPAHTPSRRRLLTRSELVRLLRTAGVADYEIRANRMLGWAMTYTVVIHRPPGAAMPGRSTSSRQGPGTRPGSIGGGDLPEAP